MIVVHHLENSRSQRILWLLEELGLAYEVKRYERDKKTNLAPKELLKVHPLGKSPVIDDAGAVIAETGAIIEHVIETHGQGRLQPARGTPDWRRYRYWMHAAEGSYMPPLVLSLMLGRMDTAPMPFFAKPIAKKLTQAVRDGYLDHTLAALFGYLDSELGKSPYLAGNDLTGADIIMSFPAEAAMQRAPAALKTARLKSYLESLQARPAYKRALARGGPYAFA
ncbi:MAG: glutathione S-transferase [Parvularculaceae bacterium]|nr:glutathione S-transferase [Parvularculaceae bacterium]